jgi:hypothetical protein
MRKLVLAAAVYLMICVTTVVGQAQPSQPPNEQKTDKQAPPAVCPMHNAHSQTARSQMDHSQMNDMNRRGEKGMGFSQTATTHHFFLNSTGGAIQVEANDPADTTSRNNIRMHLGHIAHAFQNGDFAIPMFVHDTVPPGVPGMKSLKKSIRYSFEETPNGARVVISSADKSALDAIHRFLRFQIDEHKTGDTSEIR